MNLLPRDEATLLDRLIESLRGRGVPVDGETRPAAILWPDPKREWKRVAVLARERVPELFVLGEYEPKARSGPAIWLRCEVDRAGDGEEVPILYLPGVGKQDLRAGDDCPDRLKPLIELLHRGDVWLHPNGRDWTAAGFLGSRYGAECEVAEDRETREALRKALPELAVTPLARLRGGRLEADDFQRLQVADARRDLLLWMGDPPGTRARLGERWDAFCGQCAKDLGFDPDKDDRIVAGAQLGSGEPPWNPVWDRFSDSPTAFREVEKVLKQSQPKGRLLTKAPERWPKENERLEGALRDALAGLTARPQREACDRVARLENEHGKRRTWVWAKLGRSPLAAALEPLARLAAAAKSPLGGGEPEEVRSAYLERGWGADAAAWETVAAVRGADEKLVSKVVKHLLEPWLHDSALAFQQAVRGKPLPGAGEQPLVEAGEDGCLFFVDGLRYDLGRRLAQRLEARGLQTKVDTRWAALPTVTATAKPAVTPVAGDLEGAALDETFAPRFRSGGRKADAKTVRDAMGERGYQILGEGAFDPPRSAAARGWLETGEIDKAGHHEQAGLARRLPEKLDGLAGRVADLLDSGWKTVRVVTDHGWLLLPGGLPKTDLPKHLTETRWARCAVLVGDSDPGAPRYQWGWNAGEWFAAASGISCFNKSDAFAHGGLSIQECLTPDILVERPAGSAADASITSVTWRRLRCHLVVAGGGSGWTAVLRLGGPSGEPVAQRKPVDSDGSVSLLLSGDEHETAALSVVVLDDEDRVLATVPTRVGENS